jgi:bacterioferritin-associated ferredoxin
MKEIEMDRARELIKKYNLIVIHNNGEKAITPKKITESVRKEFPQDREELIRLKPVIIPILEQSKSKTKCMECDREARNFVRQTDVATGEEKIIMALCNYHYNFIPIVDPEGDF